ncbi:hypothetical protein [Synechococcus sp. PCC 7335]|nr:hypothetical protein [Synechococcus sp. PCC 7335]
MTFTPIADNSSRQAWSEVIASNLPAETTKAMNWPTEVKDGVNE